MQYTDNLGLKLPEGTDFYDVDDMNYNSQLIDAAISGSGRTAADISYDNSDSGLSATNVQDAIDEVAQSGGGGGVGTVINLTTSYSALFNQTVTLTGTYDTYTATFDSTGHATVNVFYIDTYAVTCQGETDSVTVTAIGLVINADVFSVAVVNLTTPYSALFNQTVTLTGTNATYTSSFDASGHATVNVLYTDTYTVTCQSLTDSVTVSALGTVVNATVFNMTTVNITTSDSDLIGETISVYFGSDPTDVRASLTFDSNLSVSFQTDDIGTYNIVIGYSNPVSFTVSTVGGSVSVIYNPTPTGSSVTPVNNVRNWLDSAKVFDKNYTTISQVLSDTTTLQTLISSNNANDYLVRSTSWVSDVCANSTAMSYIGLNNYSANTLLANSTWCTAICNSTYFESVLNVKVPTMTSDTTPSGKCSASSLYGGCYAYEAFKPGENHWYTATMGSCANEWLCYKFPSSVLIKKAAFLMDMDQMSSTTYKIQASNDYSNWHDIVSQTNSLPPDSTTWKNLNIVSNTTKYNYYRFYIVSQSLSTNYFACGRLTQLQFYGRQDV